MASPESLQKAAQVWCRPEASEVEMDTRLATAFANVLDELEELHRMRLAAISTAAMGYHKKKDECHESFKTVALADVQHLYEKYEVLYKQMNKETTHGQEDAA